jgi:PAS domain-containing protein
MAAPTPQKSIVLILARELASKLATAMFIVDPDGRLVFFNEPAEFILGRTFAEAGELSREEWGLEFKPRHDDGTPLEIDELPMTWALMKHQPAHRQFFITGYDGVERRLSVTAFPLFARQQEFVGAVAIFWEERNDPAPGEAP